MISLNLVIRIAQLLETSTDYLLRDGIPIEDGTQQNFITGQENAPPFGVRLRELRLQRQLSQLYLANHLGLASRAYIAELEARRGKLPALDLVVRIADFFGVTTDDLLQGSIPPTISDADREAELS